MNSVARTKILFFSSFPPPYTGQTLATQAIYSLLEDQYHIRRLSFSIENRGVTSGQFRFSSLIHSFKMCFQLAGHLTKNRDYDYIYTVPSSTKIGLVRDFTYLITILFFARKKRIVYHVHSGNFGQNFPGILGKIFRLNLSAVHKIILLSPSLKRFEGFEEKTVYIKNFVEIDFAISSQEFKQKQSRKGGPLSVLFVSNLIASKGFEEVIKAAEILSAEPIIFHLIGKWESAHEREKWESALKAYSNVRIHGQVASRDQIRKIYLEGDVFCLPTYYPIEALPLSIIEAMSLANPIITTNHAAIPDIVKHNFNGFFVRKQDEEGIVECLKALLDRKVWREMSQNSYNFYRENLQPQAVLPFYKNIFD